MRKLKVQVWIHLTADVGFRVLLLKLTEPRGGHWQPVTGNVEDGEPPAAAALREATEESGLAFDGPPLDLDFQFEFEGRGPRAGVLFREHTFGLRTEPAPGRMLPSVKIDPHEHVDYRWVDPGTARAMLRFESNAEGLSALLRKIAPRA